MKKTADKNNYRPRLIDATVEKYLAAFGAVCIEGPKWCGKTWTSSYHSSSEFMVGDPSDNFQNRTLAQTAPALVLQGATPRLLDEWQEVPALWDAVRYTVDQRGAKGQFILTGSSTPQRKGVLHSGAGRIAKLRLRTMSLYETGDSCGTVSLQALMKGEQHEALTGEVSLKDLAYYTVRGGWPGNMKAGAATAVLLPRAYLDAIMDDDAYRLDGKRYDREKMHRLLLSLARNESTTVSKAKLLSDIGARGEESIDAATVTTYLDVFARLFLTDDQQPFDPNIRSSVRVKQAVKRHFCDPSLACALLKATPERLIADLHTFGFLFEALAEHDLRIYAEAWGGKLFHYQDYNGKEIDAVIEGEDGSWGAFEIKLGADRIDEAAASLLSLYRAIEREGGRTPSLLCVICGLASAAYRRPDGVWVVPLTALKD